MNKNWPCPNECINWCRVGGLLGMIPNHHPNCEHYNDSLIDVWKVELDGNYFYTDVEPCYKDFIEGEVITKEKLHRECYEQLEEFEGF